MHQSTLFRASTSPISSSLSFTQGASMYFNAPTTRTASPLIIVSRASRKVEVFPQDIAIDMEVEEEKSDDIMKDISSSFSFTQKASMYFNAPTARTASPSIDISRASRKVEVFPQDIDIDMEVEEEKSDDIMKEIIYKLQKMELTDDMDWKEIC